MEDISNITVVKDHEGNISEIRFLIKNSNGAQIRLRDKNSISRFSIESFPSLYQNRLII